MPESCVIANAILTKPVVNLVETAVTSIEFAQLVVGLIKANLIANREVVLAACKVLIRVMTR